MRFPNYAEVSDVDGVSIDTVLHTELSLAGIPAELMPEIMRGFLGTREVPSTIVGVLYGWTFERGWVYWIAKGPGIPVEDAEKLHEEFGQVVRVDEHCGCPSPAEYFKGFGCGVYHIDTTEGLKALAKTIVVVAVRCPRPINSMST